MTRLLLEDVGPFSLFVERLLSISGEDTLPVNRKYRDHWTGKLPSRLHVISNELPRLGDASEANNTHARQAAGYTQMAMPAYFDEIFDLAFW